MATPIKPPRRVSFAPTPPTKPRTTPTYKQRKAALGKFAKAAKVMSRSQSRLALSAKRISLASEYTFSKILFKTSVMKDHPPMKALSRTVSVPLH